MFWTYTNTLNITVHIPYGRSKGPWVPFLSSRAIRLYHIRKLMVLNHLFFSKQSCFLFATFMSQNNPFMEAHGLVFILSGSPKMNSNRSLGWIAPSLMFHPLSCARITGATTAVHPTFFEGKGSVEDPRNPSRMCVKNRRGRFVSEKPHMKCSIYWISCSHKSNTSFSLWSCHFLRQIHTYVYKYDSYTYTCYTSAWFIGIESGQTTKRLKSCETAVKGE